MKNWLKKWWFSILCYCIALFIVVYVMAYLFIDDYAFIIITHLTSGMVVPALIFVGIAAANRPGKDK